MKKILNYILLNYQKMKKILKIISGYLLRNLHVKNFK